MLGSPEAGYSSKVHDWKWASDVSLMGRCGGWMEGEDSRGKESLWAQSVWLSGRV